MDDPTRMQYTNGKIAFERNDYKTALECFVEFVDEIKGFADVWNMMGQIHHHNGDLKEAIDCFEKALAANPSYADAQLNLAVTYSDIGEYEKAEALYQKARTNDKGLGDTRIPDPYVRGKIANMHADLADVYHGIGQFRPAIEEYERALQLRPDFPDVRERLSRTLFDSGLKYEAVSELQAVRVDSPDYLPARVQLGVFLFSMGKIEAAVAEWKQILNTDPKNSKAKMYLRLAAKTKKW